MSYIFLTMPTYSQPHVESIMAMEQALRAESTTHYGKVYRFPLSLLAMGFNGAYCDCLNNIDKHGFTHFAMLHSDVFAGQGWLDTLLDEMKANDADLISAVVPLKNDSGDISCTICDKKQASFKRLNIRDVPKNATFGIADLKLDGYGLSAKETLRLCVNDGMMLLSLKKRELVEQLFFNCNDRIVNWEGEFQPQGLPEDWHFSLLANDLGLKVMATTKIKTSHIGLKYYTLDGLDVCAELEQTKQQLAKVKEENEKLQGSLERYVRQSLGFNGQVSKKEEAAAVMMEAT